MRTLRTPYAFYNSFFVATFSLTYDTKVIGAGVVGLAIARQLAARQGTSTVLLERHSAAGTETSSRNSEVIPFLSLASIY